MIMGICSILLPHLLHAGGEVRRGGGHHELAAGQRDLRSDLLELRHRPGLHLRRGVGPAHASIVDPAACCLGQLDADLAVGLIVHGLLPRVHGVRELLGLLRVLVADHGADRRGGARLAAVGKGRDDVGRDDLWHAAHRPGGDEHDVAAVPPVAGQLLGVRHAALGGVLVDLPEVRGVGAALLPGLVGGPVHGDLARALGVRLAAGAEGEIAVRQVVAALLGLADVILDQEGVRRAAAVGVRHLWFSRGGRRRRRGGRRAETGPATC
mmetsp:Transcript_81475/g.213904  ORF Transcript_81475/g.213904 Transcript_81475/m.213904 type:complete len:267 (+) Transcript_81475:109-909(+)